MCLIKELVRSADIAKSFQSPFEKMTDGYLFNNISLGDRGGADLSALVKEMQNGGSKDVLGIVATLGKVDDDNLSRLLSEYLGVETMLGIVCKTYEGVKAVETYDKEGHINSDSGIQGFGTTIGWTLDRRFLVICLENLRPYCGEFVDDDPQRRLDLLKPKLPNGECPPGFIGFAVNMIHVDYMNLLYVSDVYGLRETLFYSLFSRLQVYKSREEMLLALPLISDGAISLDGGMIKPDGFFSMGNRTDVDVRFPKPSMSANPPDSCQRTDTLPTESPTPNRPRRARAAPVWHQDFIME